MLATPETANANTGDISRLTKAWLTLRWPLLAFGVSRLLLFIVGGLAQLLFAEGPGGWHAVPDAPLLDMWARFDSGFYLNIVRDGYSYILGEQSSVAFFPLYPLLVKLLTPLGGRVLAGVVVSNLCFLVGLIYLYELTRLELSETVARKTVLLLSFFPASFFFSAVYTESTFFVLAVMSFYYARRERWGLASLAALLASATRVVGVLLVLSLGLEWLRSHGLTFATVHKRAAWHSALSGLRQDWASFLCLFSVPLGILSFMVFLGQNFADPIAFMSVQSAWGRESLGPILILQRDITGFFYGLGIGEVYWQVPVDVAAWLLGLVCAVGVWRTLGASYALFVLTGLLLPIMSSTQSLTRYLIVLFPVFMILGQWLKRDWLEYSLYALFALGASVGFALFVNWHFVA